MLEGREEGIQAVALSLKVQDLSCEAENFAREFALSLYWWHGNR
jgi:hypothetical protein